MRVEIEIADTKDGKPCKIWVDGEKQERVREFNISANYLSGVDFTITKEVFPYKIENDEIKTEKISLFDSPFNK